MKYLNITELIPTDVEKVTRLVGLDENNQVQVIDPSQLSGGGTVVTDAYWGRIKGNILSQTDLQNQFKSIEEAYKAAIQEESNARANGDYALNVLIDNIKGVIPSQASKDNQLADKVFVNSSIATNTGEFKGTFDTLEELEAVTPVKINDYGFVNSVDSSGNPIYKRYKYTATGWIFEYDLNNSSFTAEQWSAINSGITKEGLETINTKLTSVTEQLANEIKTRKQEDSQLSAALVAEKTAREDSETGIKDRLTAVETNKQDKSNLVTSLSAESTNSQYPSAKCVYDIIGSIGTVLDQINGEVI